MDENEWLAERFEEHRAHLHRAALIGLGVELFVLTILVNVVARLIVGRSR